MRHLLASIAAGLQGGLKSLWDGLGEGSVKIKEVEIPSRLVVLALVIVLAFVLLSFLGEGYNGPGVGPYRGAD